MTFMKHIETQTTPQTLQFWQDQLDIACSPSRLPYDMPQPAWRTHSYAAMQHLVLPALSQAVTRLCISNSFETLAVFATAVSIVLTRYAQTDTTSIGVPPSELRPNGGAAYLPLTLDLDPQAQVAHAIGQTQIRLAQLNRHADVAENDLIYAAKRKAHAPYHVCVVCADPQMDGGADHQAVSHDLTIWLARDQINITYAQDVYYPETIKQLAARIATVMEQICARPTAALKSLSIMPNAEKLALTALFDAPLRPSSFDTIPQIITEMATRQPNAVAVRSHDEQLSYGEVDTRSDQIAAFLADRGVTNGSKVGVYVRRSAEMVTWLLGILKLGAIYVPIDTRYPVDRVKTLLEDAPCAFCLVDPDSTYALPKTCKRIGLNAFHPQSATGIVSSDASARGEDTAYIIYTSGSTGRPKGIQISHANVVNLLEWTRETFCKEDLNLVAATTSLNFDMSIFEIFGTLAAGGTLLVLDDALDIIDSPFQNAITLIDTVPSAIAALLPLATELDSCRVINLGGEALPRALCDDIHNALPGIRVYNMYGPSETTTFSTFACVPAMESGTPNIGKPLRNTQLLICDEHGALTPTGMIGELYIGGSGVTQGYLNRPELTASKYVHCGGHGTTGQFFCTGDLVSWGPDGELRYHGRMDHQIKIRGHRVELGEVDAVLNAAPGVKTAVTIGTTLPGRANTVLVAYVVGAADIDELKAYVAARLPSYMVPSHVVALNALPLNANGKLDRAQLPEPVRSNATSLPPPPVDTATLVAGQSATAA